MDAHALIRAWLHDPPSKALRIRDHEARARRLVALALGEDAVDDVEHDADIYAAVAERLPVPSPGPDYARAVGPADGLRFHHPLSGAVQSLDAGSLDVEDEARVAAALLERIASPRRDDLETRFLTLWRQWPEALAQKNPAWAMLPADTRQPDHTIWHHADTTAAFQAADAGASLLSVAIGPVQSFISGARTLRDLWMGSFLLSHLAMAGLRVLVDEVGPTALIYPSLRGVPALDDHLRERGVPVAPAPTARRLVAALPNRFLALVPRAEGERLAMAVKASIERAWLDIAQAVHSALQRRLTPLDASWAADWERQTRQFFDVQVSLLDRKRLQLGGAASEEARLDLIGSSFFEQARATERLRALIPEAERPAFRARTPALDDQGDEEYVEVPFHTPAGTWSADVELSARLAVARRELPRVPPMSEAAVLPPKCTMLGDWEQMGPGTLADAGAFWEKASDVLSTGFGGYRLRRGERLSAVGLIKRFAFPTYFAPRLGLEATETRIPDTSTLAAGDWLRAADIDPDVVRDTHGNWNGHWLHASFEAPEDGDEPCPKPLRERIGAARATLGPPPIYYAILLFDGDELGRWLRGELGPSFREIYHPKLVDYFESRRGREILSARRPLGPARHAALSDALLRFATMVTPEVVERHAGRLIYAGGDDVLALFPVSHALAAAAEIRRLYGANFLSTGPLMGSRAGASAGIVFAHVRAPLRGALDAARSQERRAKREGRDRLALEVRRRSGEHAKSTLAWSLTAQGRVLEPPHLLSEMADVFRSSLSVRWVKELRLRMRGFGVAGPPLIALRSEMHRLLGRAEASSADHARARELADALFLVHEARGPGALEDPDALARLFETAAFLARGRDI